MKKIILWILAIITIVVIILLIPIRNDETEVNLGQGFNYVPFQEAVFDVTRFGGNGIYMYKNNMKIPVVFPNIEVYKYDSTFIIVKQKFDMQTQLLIESMIFSPNLYFTYDKALVMLEEKSVDKPNLTKSNNLVNQKIIAEIMQKDTFIKKMIDNQVNYFIIDKNKTRVLGPYKLEEFQNERFKMNIKLNFE